ncbi:MAG: sterol desaturase family protein [Cellvibrionaceae bacterium]|nr:sterol desaturase family protein [Cellvibrionaceae bacterium]
MSVSYRLASYAVYPALLLYGYAVHFYLLHLGWSLLAATYCAISTAVLLIAWLEFKLPYRRQWMPSFSDVKNDSIFLLLVQLSFILFLKIAFLVYLIPIFIDNGLTLYHLWPGHWDFWYQFILFSVVFEFFRYWSHRLFHLFTPLWRVHAVHHSAKNVYLLTTARFHPVEKTAHFIVDTLPFLLLGVSEEIVLSYFVFYAIHSFCQHANVDMKLGWLNYIFLGPELHRWHHSMEVAESDNNYGNNMSYWDLLFGTFFWPKDRRVGDLGLRNRRYPMSFLAQMKSPFFVDPNK